MKFAIYIRTVKTARGAEQVSANVALGLAQRGHQIDFLIEEDQGWLVDKLKAHPNISVINLRDANQSRFMHCIYLVRAGIAVLLSSRLPSLSEAGTTLTQLSRLVYKKDPPLYALSRHIDNAKPAVVLSYLNYPNLNLLLCALLRPQACRYVVSVRNHISTSSRKNTSNWQRMVPGLMRLLFPLADRVLAPSQGIAEDVVTITGLPEQMTSVVHNPVYRAEILALAEEPLSHPWFSDDAVPVVVAAGKLERQKDFDSLIRAFALLRQRRQARLVILGEGAERERLNARIMALGIREDVDLPGYVKNPYCYFRQAKLFVLSSAWEGLPNVLIEAMACGCPVIATDCPSGPREILEDGQLGALIRVGDIDQMADAMQRCLEHPPAASHFVERAKCYSHERAIAGYESLLQALSDPKRTLN